MAKDYGRRRSTRQKNSAPRQLFWILASFVGGYLTATVFDFTSLTSWINKNILAKQREEKPATQVVAKQEAELPKPKFEFYTLLAKDRSMTPTPIPQSTTTAQTKPITQPAAVAAPLPAQRPVVQTMIPAQKPPSAVVVTGSKPVAPPAAIDKSTYLIQIASFRNRQEAERMKAALTLKGFDVNVAAVSQQNVNWFRVIVGPFGSRMAAEKVRLTLAQSERIKGMIRKMEA